MTRENAPADAGNENDHPGSGPAASFDDLGLSEKLLQSVREAGYETPTPIQSKVVPLILRGRDVLGIARTGSGKTAGFTLPMIETLSGARARARMPRALILEPTRELAAQVEENLIAHGKHHRLTYALIIGGASMKEQQARLQRGVDVLVATPGRLLDLFERGQVLLADAKFFVIDEADRMLDMGFIPDIERITKLLPARRQTLLFTATMPPEIRRLSRSFLRDPEEVYADAPQRATTSVEQEFAFVSDDRALRTALRRRLDGLEDEKGSVLIFCNRKIEVSDLARSLARSGYDAASLHGDMPQPLRTATLERFRAGEVRILVCSDVAARGLDIPQVSHVFNYGLPNTADDYVHRIGRTGRAGRTGHAISFVTRRDEERLEDLAKVLPEGVTPTKRESGDERGGEREARSERSERSGRGERGERGGRGTSRRSSSGRSSSGRSSGGSSRSRSSSSSGRESERRGARRGPSSERSERESRSSERSERSERGERSERSERGGRGERQGRSERQERTGRSRNHSSRDSSSNEGGRARTKSAAKSTTKSAGKRADAPKRSGRNRHGEAKPGPATGLPSFLTTPSPKR